MRIGIFYLSLIGGRQYSIVRVPGTNRAVSVRVEEVEGSDLNEALAAG